MKKNLANLITLLVSLSVTSLFLELVVRQIDPVPSVYSMPLNYMESIDGVWRLTPNFKGVMGNDVDFKNKLLTTDERGVRITPASLKVNNFKNRMFILGDSQTAGVGLSDSETWANRLQEIILKENIPIKVENWGVPAINIDQYQSRLPHVLKEAIPGDTILVGISWNDLITTLYYRSQITMIEGYLVNASEDDINNSGWRSEAINKIRNYNSIGKIPDYQNIKEFMLYISRNSALLSFVYNRIRNMYLMNRNKHPVQDVIAADTHVGNMLVLAAMKHEAEKRGLNFVVLLLPDAVIFDDAAFAIFSQNKKFFANQDVMGDLTKDVCQKNNMLCLNAFDILHYHHNEVVAFKKDLHYNELGAKYISEYLFDNLKHIITNTSIK